MNSNENNGSRIAQFEFHSWPWPRGLSGGRLTNYRSGYVIVRLT